MKWLGARFLPLFQLYRNTRVFPHGKRAGHSPLQLAGVATPDGDWLEWLGLPTPPTAPRRAASAPCPAPREL